MGTDVNAAVERLVSVRQMTAWVGLHAFPRISTGEEPVRRAPARLVPREGRPAFVRRDYGLFNTLAGVRGAGSERGHIPRGLPPDASDLALLHAAETGGYGHSWLPLVEAARCVLLHADRRPDLVGIPAEAEEDRVVDVLLDAFGVLLPYGGTTTDEYRLIFWFD